MGNVASTTGLMEEFGTPEQQNNFLMTMLQQDTDKAPVIGEVCKTSCKKIKNFAILHQGTNNRIKYFITKKYCIGTATIKNIPIAENHFLVHKYQGDSVVSFHLGLCAYLEMTTFIEHCKYFLGKIEFLDQLIKICKFQDTEMNKYMVSPLDEVVIRIPQIYTAIPQEDALRSEHNDIIPREYSEDEDFPDSDSANNYGQETSSSQISDAPARKSIRNIQSESESSASSFFGLISEPSDINNTSDTSFLSRSSKKSKSSRSRSNRSRKVSEASSVFQSIAEPFESESEVSEAFRNLPDTRYAIRPYDSNDTSSVSVSSSFMSNFSDSASGRRRRSRKSSSTSHSNIPDEDLNFSTEPLNEMEIQGRIKSGSESSVFASISEPSTESSVSSGKRKIKRRSDAKNRSSLSSHNSIASNKSASSHSSKKKAPPLNMKPPVDDDDDDDSIDDGDSSSSFLILTKSGKPKMLRGKGRRKNAQLISSGTSEYDSYNFSD